MNREKFTSTFAKAILAAITTSGILALGSQTASAQAITVTTPFAFSAGNQFYPVGTYEFTILSEWSLSIRNVKGGGERFFTVRPGENGSPALHAGIVFRNSEGHKNLQAVYMPGTDRGAELLHNEPVNNNAKHHASDPSTTMSFAKISVGEQNATVK
jgi:hypothetical protein